jgi:MFS family permease
MKILERTKGLRALLSKHDFRRLLVSQLFGSLGEWLATLALIALVWDRTHSAVASGVVLALRILPAAVIGGLLASVVDRFDRKRVLIGCTAGRALIYGSLPFVGGVAPVLGLALLAEVTTLAYMAARDATLPRLVPAEHLTSANAISMLSAFVAMPLGSGIFAALVWLQATLFRPGQAFGFIAAATMLSVATVQLRHIRGAAGAPAAAAESSTARAPKVRLLGIFREDPVLVRVVIGGLIVACSGGVLLTLGLAYVRETLHAGSAAYSGLMTSFALGAAAGVGAVQKARAHLPKLFHVGSIAMGAILLLMALFPSAGVGFGMSFIFGGAAVATFLGGITILQDRIDDAARGRAFAIAHCSLRVLAVGVGLFAAWVAHLLRNGIWRLEGTQIVLGFVGLVLVAAGLLLLRPARRARAALAAAAR